MTGTPHIATGEEYVVFYSGGPYDGQTDRRISTDGSWDATITVPVQIDGDDSLLVYGAPSATEVGGQVQVTYTWDVADSEAVIDPDDRDDDI